MIKLMDNKRFDAAGSHLQGKINYRYDDLVHSFGEPTITQHIDDKITCEWQLTFNLEDDRKIKATIYDYKSDVPAEDNNNWSVGGYEMDAFICVKSTLYLDHEIWEKSV